jgi:serine protease Do
MSTVATPIEYRIGSDASLLAELLRGAVVEIQSPAGGGAGIIWGGAGLVVTNAHCAPRGARVRLDSGDESHAAESIVHSRSHDLALIRAPSLRGPMLELRDAQTLRPGELVFAHGHPLGVSHALAMGALHGIVRDQRTAEPRFIVADIRLAPGNSGGPLVDAEGHLLGLNSMVVNGLGVAIPAAVVQAFVTRATTSRAA